MFGKNKKSKKLNRLSKKQWWIIGAIIAALVFGAVGTYMVTQSSAGSDCYGRTLSQGARNDCVKYMQTILNAYDSKTSFAGPTLKDDGQFGPATKSTVVNFQKWIRSQGIGYTTANMPADGVVGQQTWKALCGKAYNGSTAYRLDTWSGTWSAASAAISAKCPR